MTAEHYAALAAGCGGFFLGWVFTAVNGIVVGAGLALVALGVFVFLVAARGVR